jgi:hypothetical protein
MKSLKFEIILLLIALFAGVVGIASNINPLSDIKKNSQFHVDSYPTSYPPSSCTPAATPTPTQLPTQTIYQATSESILYAKPDAIGNPDCSSWVNACNLQTALTNASSGEEIWVKKGTYKPGCFLQVKKCPIYYRKSAHFEKRKIKSIFPQSWGGEKMEKRVNFET